MSAERGLASADLYARVAPRFFTRKGARKKPVNPCSRPVAAALWRAWHTPQHFQRSLTLPRGFQ